MTAEPDHTDDAPIDMRAEALTRDLARIGPDISIRRLQVLWAVAHTTSMTKAAKLLGVSQPSLSQQLAAFETAIGARLFERRSNTLELTELGSSVLSKAEQVLRNMQELVDSLPLPGSAVRHNVRIAGASSAMRSILTETLRRLPETLGQIDLDLYEGAPGEILDMLYARRVNIGLVAATALAETSAGFQQVPVMEDPYVLVAPETLDLSQIAAPEAELSAADQRVLNGTVQFVYGTAHSRSIQDWYDRVLPQNRLLARVRSFELAIEMVRSGLGICIAPALSLHHANGGTAGLKLYHIGLEPRRVVAMFPAHYRRLAPYARLLDLLREVGAETPLPAILPTPPFVCAALAKRDPAAPNG